MKKFFFLLAATFVAISSFSACTGDDGGEPNPSSSSTFNPSSDSSPKVLVEVACDIQVPSLGTYCWELSGYFPEPEVNENIEEGEGFCLGDIEEITEWISEMNPNIIVSGSIAEKCQNSDLVCPYSEYGEELKVYLSGLFAENWGGECPSRWRGLF